MAALAAMAGVALYLGVPALKPTPLEGPARSLTVAVQNNIFSALPVIALERGYFRQNNLKVKLEKRASGKVALKSMLDDQADIATSACIPVVAAGFERNDFGVFATIGFSDTALKVLASKKAKIDSPKDLAGKKIGVQKNSASHYFLEVFLNYHKISRTGATIKFYSPQALPEALVNGEIDAFAMRNPYLLTAREEMAGDAIVFPAPDFYRQYFALSAKSSFIDGKKDIVRDFLKALLQARDFLYERPEEAKALLKEHFGEDRSEEIEMDWEEYRFGVNLGEGFLLTLENQASWFLRRHPEKAKSRPNFLNFIYADPLQGLSPYSVTIRK